MNEKACVLSKSGVVLNTSGYLVLIPYFTYIHILIQTFVHEGQIGNMPALVPMTHLCIIKP